MLVANLSLDAIKNLHGQYKVFRVIKKVYFFFFARKNYSAGELYIFSLFASFVLPAATRGPGWRFPIKTRLRVTVRGGQTCLIDYVKVFFTLYTALRIRTFLFVFPLTRESFFE